MVLGIARQRPERVLKLQRVAAPNESCWVCSDRTLHPESEDAEHTLVHLLVQAADRGVQVAKPVSSAHSRRYRLLVFGVDLRDDFQRADNFSPH